ncbi:MAG: hypothetical protein ACYC56_14435, partial [Candidatus Aquicultor sp.]
CNLNAHGRKNVGKPYEGKPHVRFDEEGLVGSSPSLYQIVKRYKIIVKKPHMAVTRAAFDRCIYYIASNQLATCS